VVRFTPRPLYPQGKSPWYPLDRRLGGPQRQSRRGGEEKNSQALQGIEPPIIQPVDQLYTAELSGSLCSFFTSRKMCLCPLIEYRLEFAEEFAPRLVF
jgi:hypothetical protein